MFKLAGHNLREEKTFLKDKKNGDFRFLDVCSTKDPLRRSENILIAFSVIDYITYPKMKKILGWEHEIHLSE